MRELIHKHTISFKNAWAGLVWAFTTQPNFRIHLIISALVIILGWYFGISKIEWTILVFTIMLGLVAELINTALESMTDLITNEWRKEAKIAKDVAAGMMLTVALGAVCIAVFIFYPYIFT